MATQSPPSNSPDENPTSNEEPKQVAVNEPQAMADPPTETSPISAFVNSQPIREDQVRNAVSFLSHPRVRGSPVVHRRNFLERKGLTKEEIDEAFRRVPDPTPVAASGQSNTYQDAQATPSTTIQSQTPIQAIQPVTAAPSGVMSTMAKRFHWSHAVLAIGFLAVSGAGTAIVFKNALVPKLKSWIRSVVLDEEGVLESGTDGKPSLVEEAAVAAKAAAAAAADVAKVSQEMLITKNEEKKSFAEFTTLLDMQLQEMRTMKSEIAKLEGQSYLVGRNPVREEYLNGTVSRQMSQTYGKLESDMQSVRSASPPMSNEPPHSKSCMETTAMTQRGEMRPNVRPWEVGQSTGSSSYVPQPQVTLDSIGYNMAPDNGVKSQFSNDNNSVPWWQQKNARITEIENGDGPTIGSGSGSGSGSNGSVSIDYPHLRRWVPPQPPPVSMPEAAVAIRQPKSSTPKDINARAEGGQPVSEVDELQRITTISESGGQLDVNVRTGSSEINEIGE